MEDDHNIFEMEDDLQIFKMEDDLQIFKMEDDLNFFQNFRQPLKKMQHNTFQLKQWLGTAQGKQVATFFSIILYIKLKEIESHMNHSIFILLFHLQWLLIGSAKLTSHCSVNHVLNKAGP